MALFLLAPLLFFLSAAIRAWLAIKWRLRARNWIRTRGKIVDHPDLERETGNLIPVALAAEYYVNGEKRFCEDKDPGGVNYMNSFFVIFFIKQQILNTEFSYGSEVDVYFDPADPGRSCLKQRSIIWPFLSVAPPLILCILAFILFLA